MNKEKQLRFDVIKIIREAGCRLSLDGVTISHGCVIYHRVAAHCRSNEIDFYTIAMAALSLAIGCEETDPQAVNTRKRDIINSFYRSIHPDLPPLEVGSEYDLLRDSLINAELFVLRMLKFQLLPSHSPHSYLLYYVNSLKSWMDTHEQMFENNLSVLAWAMLMDSYHSDLCVRFEPQKLAVSILHLALRVAAREVPGNRMSDMAWWQAVCDDISREDVESIQMEIIDLYTSDDLDLTGL